MCFSQLAIVAAIFVHLKSRQCRIWILDFQKTNSDFEKNKLRFSKKQTPILKKTKPDFQKTKLRFLKNKLQFSKKQTPIFEKQTPIFKKQTPILEKQTPIFKKQTFIKHWHGCPLRASVEIPRVDAGDEVLANHFSQATNRAKYTSPTLQNELISILGEQIRESIVNQIPSDAPYFSILADEVTDVSNREQLSLVVHLLIVVVIFTRNF